MLSFFRQLSICYWEVVEEYASRNSARRRSLGRRKIEIKLIEDESARTVTFSKRRVGVFKKATELSILCGAQIAIIIFSLAGRPYSFGHPDVDSVLGRFSNRNMIPEHQESGQGMRIQGLLAQQLKDQLDQKNEELASKKRRFKELAAALEKSPSHISEENINALNGCQLKQLRRKLEKLREYICQLAKAHPIGSEEPPDSLNVPGTGTSVNQGVAVNEEIVSGPSSNGVEVTSVRMEGDLANAVHVQKAVNSASAEDTARPCPRNEVNLANVERVRYDSNPIPADWLKL